MTIVKGYASCFIRVENIATRFKTMQFRSLLSFRLIKENSIELPSESRLQIKNKTSPPLPALQPDTPESPAQCAENSQPPISVTQQQRRSANKLGIMDKQRRHAFVVP
jgi:hypothetical protein